MSISETVSKNTRRGRPRCRARQRLELLGPSFDAAGKTVRTQLARVYEQITTSYVDTLLGPDEQRTLLGSRAPDELSAFSSYPRGYVGFAVEFGRWVESTGPDRRVVCRHLRDLVGFLADKRGTFSHAAAHYRRARLGEQAGNGKALARHLECALAAYMRKHPATSSEDIANAVGFLAHSYRRRHDEQEVAE